MESTGKYKKLSVLLRIGLVALLVGACCVVFMGNERVRRDKNVAKEKTYIKIYDSQAIEALKRKNKELYDSLMVVSDKEPESAVIIKWKYKYITDTIYAESFVQDKDSIYHYVEDNDTLRTEVDVAARELAWLRISHSFNNRFMLINRIADNGTVETTINHSPNVEIQGVDAWHIKKPKTLKDRLFIGPSIQGGYDPIRKQATFSVGLSAGYDLF